MLGMTLEANGNFTLIAGNHGSASKDAKFTVFLGMSGVIN